MTNLSKILFLCFCLCCEFIAARGQYRFDSWTTDDGLPQNSVYSIAQTADGYLWFTTLDGLVRFDGVRFAVFNKANHQNLLSNRFTKLFVENGDTLWICTEQSGLARYRNGEFRVFTTADGLLSDRVHDVQKDADGSLLILTDKGAMRRRGEQFSIEREEDYRQFKVYLAPSGVRWEIDRNGLRKVAKDGSETRFDLPFAADKISPDRTFNYFSYVRMLETPDGALWLSAAGNLYTLKDGAISRLTKENGMPASLVRVIAQDAGGAIWIGTEGAGACHLRENRFDCFDKSKGLSSNKIFDIFKDREGTLWLGSNEAGINRLTTRVVTPLSLAEGLADKNINPILEDRSGAIWLGSFSALSRFADGKVTNFTRRDGLFYEIVQSLYEDDAGRLWVGSLGGVQYLENGKFYDFTEKLGLTIGDYDFWDIKQHRSGAFWFATNRGLIKYADGAAQKFTTADGLPSNDVKLIYETRGGTIWVGTYGGLVRFQDGKFVRISNDDQHIRTIYEDADGVLWIGTYDGGLFRFKGEKLTHYTTADGLFSNGAFQILEDARGNFWISSNQGIYRVARQQLNDFADGKTPLIISSVFGKSDGMLSTECNGGRQPAGIVAKDGRMWFPTQDGAAIIDPEKVAFNPLAPPVVVESISVGNAELPLSESLTVKPNQGNLEIHYTGLSFIKPEQVQFRYKLEGLDADWTNAANRRAAFYPYLPPGNYTFRVIAANSDNVWNETGAMIRIEVLPPFYQTRWFVLVTVLLAVGIVYVLYKRRISQLEKERAAKQTFSRQLIASQEQERKRIAAELHDSLGQRLVVIKNLALMYLNSKNGDRAEFQKVEAISSEASEAIGEVKEISYNLRPYQLDRIGLTKAIEAIIRSARAASAIEFSAKMDNIDDYFPRDSEINFYRIVQECVNNIVKHSAAKKAFIKITRSPEAIDLEIGDDGRGFVPFQTESKTGGFGLLGITERAALFGGKVEIKSAPNHGTILKMRLRKEF